MHHGFGRGWRGRHGHGFGPGGGFEPREGRMFEGGDLRLVILAMLAQKPSHGYEIIKGLGERVGGDYSPSPGVVYPTLTLLEDMGYATASQESGGRKLYTVTAEGEAFLAANKPQVDAIFARFDGAEASRRGDLAPLLRAMENLRMAVRIRARGREAKPETIQAIADALDTVAKTIERL
ncbi:MAG: PadR family transcriptional regulator [Bradyrhizobium sp.]|nr:MAG: PadR family transcriptional regulator [Bradyrhizobium sp.]